MKSKKTFYVTVALYILSFICTILSPAITYLGYLEISRKLFFLFVSISIVASMLMLFLKTFLTKKISFQMVLLYFILVIIWITNTYKAYAFNANVVWIYWLIEGIAAFVGFICWLIICKSYLNIKNIKDFLNFNTFLILIVIIVFLCSLEQLNNGIRWDSINYYAYIERLRNFTFNPNDINLFKASGHASYAFGLLYSIGESLIPSFGVGVRLETLFLFIFSIVLCYKVLKLLLPNGKEIWRIFSVSLFAITPVILGPIHNIDVEILTMFFVIAIIYSYLNKLTIIMFITSTCLVFTKETCVIFIAAFLIGEVIRMNLHSKKDKEKNQLFSYENLVRISSLYIPIVLFLVYFSVDVSWGSARAVEITDKFNTWGINNTVISAKGIQFFLMNFMWIQSLIIIFGIINWWKTSKVQSFKEKNINIVLPILFMYIGFIVTQFLYITYPFPRYIIQNYFYMAIVLQWALNQMNLSKKVTIFLFMTTISITFLQNFHSIDFITNLLYDEVNIGKSKLTINSPIVYLNNRNILVGEDAKFMAFSPYADINRQWSYFDSMINKFLSSINYDENTLIVYPDSFSPRSENIYFGMWDNTYYNLETKCLQQVMNNVAIKGKDKFINFRAVVDTGKNLDFSGYERVYILQFPYDEKASPYIDTRDSFIEIEYKNWAMKAYELKGG